MLKTTLVRTRWACNRARHLYIIGPSRLPGLHCICQPASTWIKGALQGSGF